MRYLLYLVVPGIAIRYQRTFKTFEEALRAFSATVGLVLKEPNLVDLGLSPIGTWARRVHDKNRDCAYAMSAQSRWYIQRMWP